MQAAHTSYEAAVSASTSTQLYYIGRLNNESFPGKHFPSNAIESEKTICHKIKVLF